MPISIKLETIDPEIAEVYLKRNVEHNRTIVPWKIKQYAEDMAEGRWLPTSATIKFADDGSLIDGQHRLKAIIMANRAIDIAVSRGERPDAIHVIDTGIARSGAASLTVASLVSKGAAQTAATANALWGYENGVFQNAMSSLANEDRLTNAEMVEYVTERGVEIAEANRIATLVHRLIPMNKSGIAVAYIALRKVDAEAAIDFFSRMAEGISEGLSDPIQLLSRKVNTERLTNKTIGQGTTLYLIFRAWNAWRQEESLGKFQYGSKTGGWTAIPVPR